MKKELNVHIGEVKIAKKGEVLKTILGSCVGIGFIWEEKSKCGLAHCLLARSPERTFAIGGRYVDQAIRSLIALMRIKEDDFKKVTVIVAGGGNMTGSKKTGQDLVGERNISCAREVLSELGIVPKVLKQAEDEGTRMFINSGDFTYRIEKIPKLKRAV